jgi:DNA replication protein DnaC
MQSKAPDTKTGQISRVSSIEDLFEECRKTCTIEEGWCPYQGEIPYTLTNEGLEAEQLRPEDANIVFTYDCPIWQHKQLLDKRTQRVKKRLGPLASHTFDNFDSSRNYKAFELAQKYVSRKAWEQGGWLIMYGNYGTGKTHLLAAIIQEAIMNGVFAVFASLAKISTYEFETAKNKLSELSEYDLIGLDDFGVESAQNWLTPHIFKLFDDLNESKKGLVMTTNMSLQFLQELLGDRISDRISQHAIAVELTGESMRKSLRSENVSWAE